MLTDAITSVFRRRKAGAAWAAFLAACVVVGVAGGRYSAGYILPMMVAIGFVAIALVAPRLCLLATIAATPLSFRYFLLSRAELDMPTEPFVAALVGAYVLDRGVAYALRRPGEHNPFRYPLLFFALVTLVSVTQAALPFESAKGAARAAAFVMLPFPAYLALRDTRTFHRATKVATCVGIAAALIMMAMLTPHIGRLGHSAAFQGTLFGNYMAYGAFLTVFFLPLLSLLVFDAESPRRSRRLALLLVFSGALLYCQSRGVWVSLAAGVGFLLTLRSEAPLRRKLTVVAVVVGCAALVLLIPAVRGAIRLRLLTMLDPEFASNKTRLLRWGFALLMFVQNPVLGAGHGMFARTYVNESFVGDLARFQMGAHNEYMQILAEMGAVGLLGWLWLLAAFYLYGFRLLRRLSDPYWYALAAGIMAFQTASNVHNLVGNFMAGGSWSVPFWLAYAALAAIGHITRESDGEREPAVTTSHDL